MGISVDFRFTSPSISFRTSHLPISLVPCALHRTCRHATDKRLKKHNSRRSQQERRTKRNTFCFGIKLVRNSSYRHFKRSSRRRIGPNSPRGMSSVMGYAINGSEPRFFSSVSICAVQSRTSRVICICRRRGRMQKFFEDY